MRLATQRYLLNGLDCANCAAKIESALRAAEGLGDSRVNFATASAEINSDRLDEARQIISSIEPEVEVVPAAAPAVSADAGRRRNALREFVTEQREAVTRVVAAAALMAIGIITRDLLQSAGMGWVEYAIFVAAYLAVGLDVLKAAARNAARGDVFDENTLMSIATIGAVLIRELPEAVTVMLLYKLGEAMQDYAVDSSRRSIAALVSMRPDQVRLMAEDEVVLVSPEDVKAGDLIRVQPGDRVPLDGVIVEGESFMDTAALTGESVPRRASRGDRVLAGMVCTTGLLTVEVERPFAESAISRILELVEGAASRKAHTEQAITSFSRYYTPAVVAVAAAIAVIPPLVVAGASFSTWVSRALVLLVISCPCALVISVPLGYFAGIGAASREGILVKGANFLDVLADVGTIVFDKTGTLTEGTFTVSSIHPHNGHSETEVLEAAAAVETASPHPIAASILAASGQAGDGEPGTLEDYEEVSGYGVRGRTNGRAVLAGNDRFMHLTDVPHDTAVCDVPGTVVHVAVDGVYHGYIVISDRVKAGAEQAIAELRQLGVSRLHILSGDDSSAVEQVRARLGLDQAWAELLPGDKLARMEELVASGRRQRVAYVGDGINDTPVLTRADAGIAMGALGSDAAIEAADVVIMDDDLTRLPAALQIARRTRRVVRQNIIFSLVVKTGFMLLGAVGLASVWMAVFADVGVSLLAVLNSVRVLRLRPRTGRLDEGDNAGRAA